jgi:ABC-2 type transport system permease protein
MRRRTVHRIRFIARKELYHLLRDPRSLIIIFIMPVMMTALYGYAVRLDIDSVELTVVDLDRSAESRELTRQIFESPYFDAVDIEPNLLDQRSALRRQETVGILMINPGFAEALAAGRPFELGLTVDGSDNLLSAAVLAYAEGAVGQFMKRRLPPDMELPGITVSRQVLYNPDLESSHFFVPAIIALILIMISALLTSVTIAREKETGTMEQLLVTPVKAREILAGKLAPYIVIAFIDGILVLVFAKLLFGVPFVGSMAVLALLTVLYVSTSLAIGILISSIVSTQQVAMMFALVATLLPSLMLSGFIFAIKNLPALLYWLSFIVPARYYIYAVRGIMLKGAGLELLLPQSGALLLLTLAFMTLAAKKFKTRIA